MLLKDNLYHNLIFVAFADTRQHNHKWMEKWRQPPKTKVGPCIFPLYYKGNKINGWSFFPNTSTDIWTGLWKSYRDVAYSAGPYSSVIGT